MDTKFKQNNFLQTELVTRAIVYARVSTDEQAEQGTSLDIQVEKSLAYAEANNIKVVAIFREDYSGKTLDRPELIKARDMLRNGEADAFIVYKPNRLDRSEWGINLLLILQELKSLSIELHYSQANRKINLHEPIEALMQSIAGWQAGEDHRETITKLNEGRRKTLKDGYITTSGGSPYGYDLVQKSVDRKGKRKRWHFMINEDEAKIVRLIFKWYVFGDESGKPLTPYHIAQKLTAMGVLTKSDKIKRYRKVRGRGEWHSRTVFGIIANEIYAGVWCYGKRTPIRTVTKAGKTKTKWVMNPTSKHIKVNIPAIIDKDLWKLAVAQRKRNKTSKYRRKYNYLLSSIARCKCGYKMKPTGRDNYRYYVCGAKVHKAVHPCDLPYFRVDEIDKLVWEWIEEIFSDKQKLRDGLMGYQTQTEKLVSPLKIELKLVNKEQKEKEIDWQDIYESLKVAKTQRTKAALAADLERIEAILTELEKKRRKLGQEIETNSITNEQIMEFEQFSEQIKDDFDQFKHDFESRRLLIERLNIQATFCIENDEKIVYLEGKLTNQAKRLVVKGIITSDDTSQVEIKFGTRLVIR